jgi:hypothetical protein
MKNSVLALCALTMCVLAACGGGGGDSGSTETAAQVQADPALAKYVGTWESCDADGDDESQFSRARILSVQGDMATVELDYAFYNVAGCTGAPEFDITGKGTAKLAGGTKVLAGRTYEKVTLTYTGMTLRAGSLDFAPPMPNATTVALVALGSDGKFHFGRGSRDADGYPKSESPIALTKRP